MKRLALSILALLAACATPPTSTKPQHGYTYGPWQTLPSSCQVRGLSTDFTITTSGEVEDDTLYLEITFNYPLPLPPQAEITGLPIPITIEGKNNRYTLQLPFLPPVAAHLMQPDTHLLISYVPMDNPQTFESSLATQPLTEALGQLGLTCR